jgi:protein deglycase
MKKKILLVLADGFEDVEAVAAIDVLNRAGIEVTVAGLHPGPVHAAYGTTLLADTTIDGINEVYDGIVFPGGRVNAQSLAAHPLVLDLIAQHLEKNKLVAAICASPALVLGQAAGVLTGKRATGDPAFNDKLAASGAELTHEQVTIDGNIITGMGPGAALRFGLTLAAYLVGRDAALPFAQKWSVEL